MGTARIDGLAKALAARRSRRRVLRRGGAGVADAALGAVAARPAPAEAEALVGPAFLFVQTAAGGTWAPKPGAAGVYTLTLTGAAAQTVYFSERPERIVGAVPTERFLAGLGFTPTSPPNAAVVARTAGGEDVLVVELFDPVYAEGTGPDGGATLTYDVRILADYRGEGLAHLAARQEDDGLPAAFGAASLFIDDCADQPIRCCTSSGCSEVSIFCGGCDGEVGSIGPMGFCWDWGTVSCNPCNNGDPGYWAERRNEMFPACNGGCGAFWSDWDAG